MRYLMLCLSLLASPVFAQPYFGADAFTWTYEEEGYPDATATGVRFRVGYALTEYFALEGQLALGGEDTVLVYFPDPGVTVPVDLELDHLFAVMARPQLPLNEQAKLYGLVGFSQGELTASAGGSSISEDDSGLSIGVGAEFHLSDNVWLGGDFVSYLREDSYDFTALSLGARFTF